MLSDIHRHRYRHSDIIRVFVELHRIYGAGKRFTEGVHTGTSSTQTAHIILYEQIYLKKMVTTIKITCDGVFIQTNSYRIRTTTTSATVSDRNNNTNGRANNNSAISNNGFCGNDNGANNHNAFYISTESTTVSSPASLPTVLSSVSTLPSSKLTNRILIGTTSASTSNLCSKFGRGDTSTIFGRISRSDSKVQLIRSDHDVKCKSKTLGTSTSNGSATVRRRNTFKNYLIECKENLIRRLSSPTSANGQ